MKLIAKNEADKEYIADLSAITKGAGITFSGMIGEKCLLFFYTIFIANTLATSDLGIYFLGITIIMFLTVLSNLGLTNGVIRFVSMHNGRNDVCRVKGTVLSCLAISMIASLGMTGIIFLLGDIIAVYIFHKSELGEAIRLLSLSIPFVNLLRIFLTSTRALKLMQYTVYAENLAWIGLRFLFALFFLWVLKLGLKGIILAYVVSSVLSAGLGFYFCCRFIPLVDKRIKSIFEIKRLLKFSVPMVFSAFFHNLNTHVDILMLGLFVSATEVAIYTVSARLIILGGVVLAIFQPIFQPFVSDFYAKKEMEKIAILLKTITKWIVIISFPIFVSLVSFPAFFLHFFGDQFVQGAGCLSILAIAYILSSISGPTNTLIIMSGRSDITLKNNLTVLITNTILNYLLIPKYGIVGAALATGISLVLIALIRIIEANYLMKIHPFRMDLWKPISAGLMSSILILFLHSGIPIVGNHMTILLLFLFCFSYLLFIYLFRLSKEDIYIKSLIQKKLSFFSR